MKVDLVILRFVGLGTYSSIKDFILGTANGAYEPYDLTSCLISYLTIFEESMEAHK